MAQTRRANWAHVTLTALLLALMMLPALVHAASMEIWPSERGGMRVDQAKQAPLAMAQRRLLNGLDCMERRRQ